MSVYMTEEEQLESIKKWWGKYGNIITLCLSLVLLTVAGIRYMDYRHTKLTQEASNIYEKMINDYSNRQNEAVMSYATVLINDYGRSVYADAAHMTLAKIHVSNDKFEEAKKELQAVVDKTKMSALRQVAKIRIARLLAAEKAYEKALNELAVVDDKAYLPLVNELRGDIHSAKGQYKDAISAYKMAMDEVKSNGMSNLFLEMKTNELASKNEDKGMIGNKTQST